MADLNPADLQHAIRDINTVVLRRLVNFTVARFRGALEDDPAAHADIMDAIEIGVIAALALPDFFKAYADRERADPEDDGGWDRQIARIRERVGLLITRHEADPDGWWRHYTDGKDGATDVGN